MDKLEKTPAFSEADKQKRSYFASFARAHASAFRPHWKEGETLGRDPEVWRNVSEHCLVEGVLADVLAEELHMSPEERQEVVIAALMHDWYKKREIEAHREAEKSGASLLEAYERSRVEDARILGEFDLSPSLSPIIDAVIPDKREGPQTLQQKIMWYVDLIVSNTHIVLPKERLTNLERGWDGKTEDAARGARNRAISDMFKPRYGGLSLYDVQRELVQHIEPELARLAGFVGAPEDFPLHLRQKIEGRIASVTS